MSRTARSLVGFGCYVCFMGTGLLLSPNTLLFVLLTKPTSEHWIRLLGATAVVLGSYYIVAGRHDVAVLARASVWARLFMIAAFSALVVFGIAPVLLLGIAGNEALGVAWTVWALRADGTEARVPTGGEAVHSDRVSP